MKNKDIKNIVYNSIRTCLSIVFPVVTFPYILRVLQADNVGKLNFSQSIISYFAMLATLGISTYAIRECSKVRNDRGKFSAIASEVYSINLYSTIFSYSVLIILVIFSKKLVDYRTLILIYSVNIISSTLGTDWINTAVEDFKFLTIRSFIFHTISIIAMFLFVKNSSGYLIYAIISVTSNVLICVSNIFYRKRFCDIKFVLKPNFLKHIKPIAFLFVTILSQNIFNNCDITMLGLTLGNHSVGIYTTAHRVINIVFMVVASICWVMMPQLSILFSHENYESANELLHQIISFTIALAMPIVCGINLLAQEIILLVGGSSYLESVQCLRILSLAMSISFFIGVFGNMVLIPSGNDKLYMTSCIIAMITNVIGNFFLIPTLGTNGASIATVLSELINLIIILLLMDRRVKVNGIIKLVSSPLLGCITIVLICLLFKSIIYNIFIKTFLSILFSSIIYFIILILMKNEFAIYFIFPILRKLRIINE